MSLEFCPQCRGMNLTAVLCIAQEGIPHGTAGHIGTYREATLYRCALCRGSTLHIFDHDCWDQDDPVGDMTRDYTLGPYATELALGAIARCPEPQQVGCQCPVHSAVRLSVTERLPALSGKSAKAEITFADLSL